MYPKILKINFPCLIQSLFQQTFSVEFNRICKMHLKILGINQVKKVYKVKENTWCYTMNTGPIFRTDLELKTFNTKKKIKSTN